MEEPEFYDKYKDNLFYQQRYPGFYMKKGCLCYSFLIIVSILIMAGSLAIQNSIGSLYYKKIKIPGDCVSNCNIDFTIDRDLVEVEYLSQISLVQVLRKYVTSLVYDSFEGEVITSSYDLNKNCTDMIYVEQAKAFLGGITSFQNLNGDELADDSILYPCGYTSVSYLLTDKLSFKKYNTTNSTYEDYSWNETDIGLKSLLETLYRNNSNQSTLSYIDNRDRHYINWVSLNYNSIKLYAINDSLDAGDYRIVVDYKYSWLNNDKSKYDRHIIIQEGAWFGNKNQILHYIGYFTVGLILVSIVYDLVHNGIKDDETEFDQFNMFMNKDEDNVNNSNE